MMNRPYSRLCIGLALTICGHGCSDLEWNWPSNPRSAARPRPIQPTRVRGDELSETPLTQATGTTQPPAARSVSTPAPAESLRTPEPPRVEHEDELFRLDLTADKSRDATDSHRTTLHPTRMTPGTLGRMIEMLYVPLGSGGSGERFYLIYQDRASWTAAREWSATLDSAFTAPTGGAAARSADADTKPVDAFADGVSRLADLIESSRAPKSAAVEQCQSALASAIAAQRPSAVPRQIAPGPQVQLDHNPTPNPAQTWTAAMLAGRAAAEFAFDDTKARALYQQAEKAASPGSIEQLMSLWATAETYDGAASAAQRRAVYQRIRSQCAAQSECHLFQRASEGR